MIEIIKELNIEVSKPNVLQAVVAKQYDMNTRFIKATFVDDGKKIVIDPNATVKVVINALRPDGESNGFEGKVNEDGTVTVPLHSWMLELVGTVTCDISVIDIASENNKKLTTTTFTLMVEKAAFGGDDITSDPQYDVLVALLDAAAVAQEALDKSNEANSKYDACVEATANANQAADNANAVREEVEAGGYIESLKELNEGKKFSFWVGTSAEYEAVKGEHSNCLHIITDEEDIEEILQNMQSEIDAGFHSGGALSPDKMSDMDAITGNGVYWLDISCMSDSIFTENGFLVTYYEHTNDNRMQEYTSETGSKCRRCCDFNGVWGEWEWENPPMEESVEYLTTERWLGEPVYTKLVECGLLGNNYSTRTLHYCFYDANDTPKFSGHVIRHCGSAYFVEGQYSTLKSTSIPSVFWGNGTEDRIDVSVSDYAIYIKPNYDCSTRYAYVQLWYTKKAI